MSDAGIPPAGLLLPQSDIMLSHHYTYALLPPLLPVLIATASLAGPTLARQASGEVDAPCPGHVVFSELMWMGSEASSADEWIELYNAGPAPVNLQGWCITRLVKGAHQVMIELGDAHLEAGGTFLIANYGPSETRSRLAVRPDTVATAIALANSRLQLRLFDGPPDSGATMVDVADDGRGAPLAGSTGPPASMVRVDLEADGSTPEAWATATDSQGWKHGSVEFGTPGTGPDIAPVDPRTGSTTAIPPARWGALKLARSTR